MSSKEQLKATVQSTLKMLESMPEPTKSMMLDQLKSKVAAAGLDWDEVAS